MIWQAVFRPSGILMFHRWNVPDVHDAPLHTPQGTRSRRLGAASSQAGEGARSRDDAPEAQP